MARDDRVVRSHRGEIARHSDFRHANVSRLSGRKIPAAVSRAQHAMFDFPVCRDPARTPIFPVWCGDGGALHELGRHVHPHRRPQAGRHAHDSGRDLRHLPGAARHVLRQRNVIMRSAVGCVALPCTYP